MRISDLEEEIKRLNDKVELLTKIQRDFERGDCGRLSDDDTDRELKVTRVTTKCVWIKRHVNNIIFKAIV